MLILSTDSLKGYGLNRIFDFAKEAGYDGIELVLETRIYDTQNVDYINSLVKEYGVPVVAVPLPVLTVFPLIFVKSFLTVDA